MAQNHTDKKPTIIEREAYEAALNCMPPLRYYQGIFAMCEMLTGNLTAWYAERDGQYATCIDYIDSTHEHMIKRFSQVI